MGAPRPSRSGVGSCPPGYFQNQPGFAPREARLAHIWTYIQMPEMLKKTIAKPDRVAMNTPSGPKLSPEWR